MGLDICDDSNIMTVNAHVSSECIWYNQKTHQHPHLQHFDYFGYW